MAINYLSIDHMIVYASILITLIVGLHAGKGIKTIREYAVGNKMFGTTTLVLTYLATNLAGASIINVGSMIFSDGIILTVALLGLIISSIVLALFIVPHAVYFPNCMTMGDIMEQLYGTISGVIAGLLGWLSSIFLASMELIVLGIICESLIGINAKLAIFIGGFILTLYAAHGGIKSVVTTDVLQFLMVVVGLPIIAYMGVTQVGGLGNLLSKVPQEKWMIMNHPKFYFYLNLFLLFTVFPAGMIDSAIIQRLLMGKTKKQLRDQYLIVAFVDPLFQFIVMLIALAGVILYPTGEGTEIVPHMINDFFPVGVKGLAIAGLLAIVMSTIDSHLHVTGLMLVHDIIKPFIRKKVLSDSQEKKFAQYATLLVGIVAISIGLHTTDMFGLLLDSLEATGPILMFPLLTGMIGLKPEKKAFYVAMFVTIAAWVMCKLYLPEDYSYLSILLCILANGSAFFGTHLYLNKGFKRSDRRKVEYLSEYHTAPAFFDRLPQRIYAYVKKQYQSQELSYILAGVSCLIHSIIPHLLCDKIIHFYASNLNWLFLVYSLAIVLCILLMLKDKYSAHFQATYLPFFFYSVVL